ncbi:creatinine amidohydrolase [Catalinimonas alkaloidigena]|uniref:Creatinine amidohydrolase n=1 Tax=Catalinimonas alkaloidigena TaxID=1075417 RepID=A0A1G9D964_9BACT|nr:creatininase family protein [Catalinimonas alkaloidigena]SDK60407.1 creatinine amidohydrolase [Catalinimonas alkaloidigena]
MSPRPYVLAETNWKAVQQTDYQVAVLPWGATEAHNYHMPYATDNYQCDYIAAEACRQAWEQGVKAVALPTIPFGVNTGQLDIKLDLNLNPSTQLIILRDLIDVVQRAGISRFVVLNGHGGNDFKQMLRELQPQFPDVFLCLINWFKVEPRDGYFQHPGDHADEMETSVMMHIQPDLVLDLSEAGSGAFKTLKLEGFRKGWAWAQREWSKATVDTGTGNPAEATADKGRRYLEAVTQHVGRFLVELSRHSVDELYG